MLLEEGGNVGLRDYLDEAYNENLLTLTTPAAWNSITYKTEIVFCF